MFLNYVNSDDIWGQINVNRLIYRTSTLNTVEYKASVGIERDLGRNLLQYQGCLL